MWVPARPARKVFATVLHVKNHETMLPFVIRGGKVTATKQKLAVEAVETVVCLGVIMLQDFFRCTGARLGMVWSCSAV